MHNAHPSTVRRHVWFRARLKHLAPRLLSNAFPKKKWKQIFKKKFKKTIERADILKLTDKPVRRIYKLDIDELNAQIKTIEEEWGDIGFVPKSNIRTIQKRYSEAISKLVAYIFVCST